MNYRHAFHAGNHADVLKHVVLARVMALLAAKEKPFAMLDAHAGVGRYDLEGVQANKTGEWQGGVAKIIAAFEPEVERVLADYRAVLAAMNPQNVLRYYPGSPEVALHLMRGDDRLVANELHPADAEELAALYEDEKRMQVTSVDFVQALKAQLPFRERRGVVLIDPPFEVLDETAKVVQALTFGYRRMAAAVFVIWYPVTTDEFASNFVQAVQDLQFPNMLQVELRIKEAFSRGGLSGSGLIIINPPWTLEKDMRILLPALAERLGIGAWGRGEVKWLTPPR